MVITGMRITEITYLVKTIILLPVFIVGLAAGCIALSMQFCVVTLMQFPYPKKLTTVK